MKAVNTRRVYSSARFTHRQWAQLVSIPCFIIIFIYVTAVGVPPRILSGQVLYSRTLRVLSSQDRAQHQPLVQLPPQGTVHMIDSMLANGTGPYALDEVIRRAVAPNLPVVLKTQTKPPFWLAVYRKAEGVREDGPDGRWDSLAALVLSHGYWEYEETEVVYKILSDRCRTGTPIVVDVGGYVGYYTLLAAKMGCRVHVWEGSPRHAAMIQFSVWMNGLADRVSIHNNICAPGSKPLRFLGDNLNSHVANSFFGTDNPKFLQEILESAEEEKTGGLPVHPLAIDDVIQEEVLLLKVDVQGYEAHVFRSAKQLLARQMVCYVIFEFSMWRGMNVADGVQMVLDILSWGYTVSNIPHSRCKLEHFTTRWQVEQLALKLQKNADSCHKYNVYMLATRRNMPQIFALT